jgi:hypothetical protein
MLALGGVVLVLAAVAMLWFRGQLRSWPARRRDDQEHAGEHGDPSHPTLLRRHEVERLNGVRIRSLVRRLRPGGSGTRTSPRVRFRLARLPRPGLTRPSVEPQFAESGSCAVA